MLMPNARELAQLVGTQVDGDCWLNDSAQELLGRWGSRGVAKACRFSKEEQTVCVGLTFPRPREVYMT